MTTQPLLDPSSLPATERVAIEFATATQTETYPAPGHVPQTLTRIDETHRSELVFNVMADRPVRENLHVKQYRVAPRYGEAHFDRTYESSMAKSPSHLIFLSALTHTQKLLYVVLCHEFGFDYEATAPERFKMWPTKVSVKMPELIDAENGLVQRLWIKQLKRFDARTYRTRVETRVGSMAIEADIPTFLLEDRPNGRS